MAGALTSGERALFASAFVLARRAGDPEPHVRAYEAVRSLRHWAAAGSPTGIDSEVMSMVRDMLSSGGDR